MIKFLGPLCLFVGSALAMWPIVAKILSWKKGCLVEGMSCELFGKPCCEPFICTRTTKPCQPKNFFDTDQCFEYKCLPPLEAEFDLDKSNHSVPTSNLIVNQENVKNVLSKDNNIANNSPEHSILKSEYEPLASDENGQTNKYEHSEHSNDTQNEASNESMSEIANKESHHISKVDHTGKISASHSSMDDSFEDKISKDDTTLSTSAIRASQSISSFEINSTETNSNDNSVVNDLPKTDRKSVKLYAKDNNLDSSFQNYSNESSVEQENFLSAESRNNSFESEYSSSENTSFVRPKETTHVTNTKTNTAEHSDEDWHSSQMRYDDRKELHKVVTVPPFHLLHSVELTRLNTSIETE